MSDYSTFDEALEIVAQSGPVLRNGLSNHAPMAAEAMCALGRADAVMPWLERYREQLAPLPHGNRKIGRDDWRESLGKRDRMGDWIAFFQNELEELAWPDVLERWVPRLAAGFIAAANHGVIRTGHAVRALAEHDSRGRCMELAQGLGSWAASYMTLPERQGGVRNSVLPSQAIANVRIVPLDQRERYSGRLIQGVAQLKSFEPFADAINMVSTEGDLDAFLSDLALAFARAYVASEQGVFTTIALIHSVTGPAALHLMLPHLSRETGKIASLYAWQASAALYTAFARGPGSARAENTYGASIADLAERAIATGDEHAIKFTEACTRESALNPHPEYIAAATHAVGLLGQRSA